LIEHLVALVENELADIAKLQVLVTDERIKTTWSRDNDVWVSLLISEDFDILVDLGASIEDASLDVGKVLAEALVLSTNLVGQFTGMAHNQD
jgi:hypothetical protein